MSQSDHLPSWRDELVVAAAFLTRLPLGRAEFASGEALASAVRAFPLVGAGIGLGGALAFALAAHVGVPAPAAALLAVAATASLTGALHEDGLADSADGLIGGRDRDEALDIMRDSRSGVFGVLALIFSVSLRAAALAALPIAAAAAALIAANAASRALLPLVMSRLDPARADGLGAGAGRPSEAGMRWALALGAIIALLALGIVDGVVALAAATVAVAATAGLARRRVGGYTGDVLGACQQSAEVVMLLVVAALA